MRQRLSATGGKKEKEKKVKGMSHNFIRELRIRENMKFPNRLLSKYQSVTHDTGKKSNDDKKTDWNNRINHDNIRTIEKVFR